MKVYEIVIADAAIYPSVELVHYNPRTAALVFESIREPFGSYAVAILRDGVQITVTHSLDIEILEIERVIEQDTLLPSGYRQGRGGDSDLALATDGYAHAVDKPPNRLRTIGTNRQRAEGNKALQPTPKKSRLKADGSKNAASVRIV